MEVEKNIKRTSQKITCVCGMTLCYSNMASHKRNREHLKRIEKSVDKKEENINNLFVKERIEILNKIKKDLDELRKNLEILVR